MRRKQAPDLVKLVRGEGGVLWPYRLERSLLKFSLDTFRETLSQFRFFGLFGVHRFYTGKYLTGGLPLIIIGMGAVSELYRAEILPAVAILMLTLWRVTDMARIIGKFTDKEGRPIIDWV